MEINVFTIAWLVAMKFKTKLLFERAKCIQNKTHELHVSSVNRIDVIVALFLSFFLIKYSMVRIKNGLKDVRHKIGGFRNIVIHVFKCGVLKEFNC